MPLKMSACLLLVLLGATTNSFSFNQQSKNQHTGLGLSVKQPISAPSISGVWDFKVKTNRGVGTDGFIRKESRSYEWVIRLKQEGQKLSGDLIGGRGSRGENVCADADVSGSVNDGSITFVVTYQGSCCNQEQMKFTGELSDDGKTLTGSLEPVDVPRSYSCSLWYADITAIKR
jgi:hypothetical protein